MAEMEIKERSGAINPEKDFHLDVAPGRTQFHVKGMDNVDWGMKDRLSRIFSPGFSTKINYTTGQVKRGLGLSLVRDLAENELSGSVTAGCSGGLTFFTVTVPRAALEE